MDVIFEAFQASFTPVVNSMACLLRYRSNHTRGRIELNDHYALQTGV